MNHIGRLTLASLLLAACVPQPYAAVAVPDCPTATTADIHPLDSARVSALEGRFLLTQVITTRPAGREPLVWREGILTLRPATPENLSARPRMFGRRVRRDLRLFGSWVAKGNSMQMEAEVDGGVLYIGCRDCFDEQPDLLFVQGISRDRIWGSWQSPKGYVIPADPVTQEPLDKVAGVFCAVRRDATSPP